jgi:hypothetical protein
MKKIGMISITKSWDIKFVMEDSILHKWFQMSTFVGVGEN